MTRAVSSVGGPGGAPFEQALRAVLGLRLVGVEYVLPGEDRRIAAIRATARYLDRESPTRIAVGWGLSLRSLPGAVRRRARKRVEVCEITGRAEWWAPEDGPFDISAALADRYGGRAYQVPAPAFATSAQDAQAHLKEPAVVDALTRAALSDVVLVGPSTADPETSSIVLAGGLTRSQMKGLRSRGAVGDIVCQFYDADGNAIDSDLDQRTVRLSLEQLRAANVVGIATGTERLRSIVGAARCGLLKGLITDDRTATELLEMLGQHRDRLGGPEAP